MNNNEPNKIVNKLYKRFIHLHEVSGGDADKYDFKAEGEIAKELRAIHGVVGAVEVMSKKALMQLVYLNGRLRAIPFHQFHFPFSDALKIN
jgi:hypothetical protein